ncbi:MAG: Ig-like domain-containing protein [Euryhalocaulis sp.]|uniref:Ig-like domain-containing protein n=1 Tax=Euryhalocaulis sp. TaxID=2744307 RepID=UPI0017A2AAF7|nr:Ig-like domain-containing protein [Euryhalocaulis sp.]MBA4800813.1 Ig-like domain-containing protein [Euryhalocaulis sp.]
MTGRTHALPLICLAAILAPLQAHTQPRDSNAPFQDGYDALYGDDLVGEWEGTVSGSTVSQADGRLGGQAVFVKRGYENREDFGLVLHDQLNRRGRDFSEIRIGMIPCGPEGRRTRLVHGLELRDAPPGSGTLSFQNTVADTGRDDMTVQPGYGPALEKPAILQTEWTDESFTLTVSGQLKSAVLPMRNGVLDYESDQKGWIEQLGLNLQFELPRTPETEELFQSTLCRQAGNFNVVETRPVHGKENVVLSGAEFDVEFSEDLYQGSFDSSTIMLTTLDPDGGYIYVDADYSLETPTTLRIIPRERLRPGTIYDITLTGGDDGIVGADGQTLEEDYEFTFSTLVEPDNVRLDIYQVSRNATLVNGKPASARIYVDWEELEDIHPDRQVTSYPVQVEVRDTRDKVIFPMRERRAMRPDQFTDEDRRFGDDSLNLFGWTPSSRSQPATFVAEVLPDEYYPADPEREPDKVEREMEYAGQHVSRLTVDYFIAAHSEWLPDGPEEEAIQQIIRSAHRERAFANQILPVADVTAHYRGVYNVMDTICGIPGIEWVMCGDGFNNWSGDHPVAAVEAEGNWAHLLRLFEEHVAARSSADILVSYHPPSLSGGQTNSPFDQPPSLPLDPAAPDPALTDMMRVDGASRNVITMGTSGYGGQGAPAILRSPMVVHEFGHVFALPHIPFANGPAHRKEVCKAGYKTTAANIDGMRIALNGQSGAVKSSENGNAETTAPLLNLMFPCLWEPRRDYWIDGQQYEWLVERMPDMLRINRTTRAAYLQGRAETRRAGRLPAAGNRPVRQASFSWTTGAPEARLWRASYSQPAALRPEEEAVARDWIMISGLADGENSGLLPAITVRGPRDRLSAEDGAYEIRIEDADCRVIARSSAGPGLESGGKGAWPFSVTLPVSGEPARIVFSRGSEILAERRTAESLRPPELISHIRGGVYRAGERLEWRAESGDPNLIYTVRFAPDGETWSTLAMFLTDTGFTPDPQILRPGAAAAFEIIAHDGVRERSTRLPVKVDVPLKPLLASPSADALTAAPGAGELVFNAPLDPASLNAVHLSDETGLAVPSIVDLEGGGTVLMVVPAEPEPDTVYKVIAGRQLRTKDGRTLGSEVSWQFRTSEAIDRAAPALEPSAVSAVGPVGDNVESANAVHENPGQTGAGELTLEFGREMKLAAEILTCSANASGKLVEAVFEIEPGTQQMIRLEESARGILRATLDQGKGVTAESNGQAGENWALDVSGGHVSGSGILKNDGMRANFAIRGLCPGA